MAKKKTTKKKKAVAREEIADIELNIVEDSENQAFVDLANKRSYDKGEELRIVSVDEIQYMSAQIETAIDQLIEAKAKLARVLTGDADSEL